VPTLLRAVGTDDGNDHHVSGRPPGAQRSELRVHHGLGDVMELAVAAVRRIAQLPRKRLEVETPMARQPCGHSRAGALSHSRRSRGRAAGGRRGHRPSLRPARFLLNAWSESISISAVDIRRSHGLDTAGNQTHCPRDGPLPLG
jgi:hypothetical protein